MRTLRPLPDRIALALLSAIATPVSAVAEPELPEVVVVGVVVLCGTPPLIVVVELVPGRAPVICMDRSGPQARLPWTR